MISLSKSYSPSVGVGTLVPASNAILDIKSTDKGVLFPRMTRLERDNINIPATGLLIFQTNERKGLYYNAGTTISPNWEKIGGQTDTLVIGSTAFYPRHSDVPYTGLANGGRFVNSGSSTAALYATVQLPAGAVVSKMSIYYKDNSTTTNLSIRFDSEYLEEGFFGETPFNYTTSNAANDWRKATISNSYRIASNLYSYHISVSTLSGTWSTNGACLLKKLH